MPIYNEAEQIRAVCEEWLGTLRSLGASFQLLAFNDGSRDETLGVLKALEGLSRPQLTIIDQPNAGHGATCRRGYERALQMGSPWVAQVDSDGQCDPAFFPAFWHQRESSDCLFAIRTRRDDGLLRTGISSLCRWLIRLAYGLDLRDPNVPYRLIRRDALARALPKIPPDVELQNIALTFALKRDRSLRWTYLPIRFRARSGGHSHFNLLRMATLGWGILKDLKRVAT